MLLRTSREADARLFASPEESLVFAPVLSKLGKRDIGEKRPSWCTLRFFAAEALDHSKRVTGTASLAASMIGASFVLGSTPVPFTASDPSFIHRRLLESPLPLLVAAVNSPPERDIKLFPHEKLLRSLVSSFGVKLLDVSGIFNGRVKTPPHALLQDAFLSFFMPIEAEGDESVKAVDPAKPLRLVEAVLGRTAKSLFFGPRVFLPDFARKAWGSKIAAEIAAAANLLEAGAGDGSDDFPLLGGASDWVQRLSTSFTDHLKVLPSYTGYKQNGGYVTSQVAQYTMRAIRKHVVGPLRPPNTDTLDNSFLLRLMPLTLLPAIYRNGSFHVQTIAAEIFIVHTVAMMSRHSCSGAREVLSRQMLPGPESLKWLSVTQSGGLSWPLLQVLTAFTPAADTAAAGAVRKVLVSLLKAQQRASSEKHKSDFIKYADASGLTGDVDLGSGRDVYLPPLPDLPQVFVCLCALGLVMGESVFAEPPLPTVLFSEASMTTEWSNLVVPAAVALGYDVRTPLATSAKSLLDAYATGRPVALLDLAALSSGTAAAIEAATEKASEALALQHVEPTPHSPSELHVLFIRYVASLLLSLRTHRGATDAIIVKEHTQAAVNAYRRSLERPEVRVELTMVDEHGRVPFDALRAALSEAGDPTYGDDVALAVAEVTRASGAAASAPVPAAPRSAVAARARELPREEAAITTMLRAVIDELKLSYLKVNIERRRIAEARRKYEMERLRALQVGIILPPFHAEGEGGDEEVTQDESERFRALPEGLERNRAIVAEKLDATLRKIRLDRETLEIVAVRAPPRRALARDAGGAVGREGEGEGRGVVVRPHPATAPDVAAIAPVALSTADQDAAREDAAIKATESIMQTNLHKLIRDLPDKPWEITFTEEARTDLENKKQPRWLKMKVLETILNLADGTFSEQDRHTLVGAPPTMKFFSARVNRCTRVLWEQAIDFSERLNFLEGHLAGHYGSADDRARGAVKGKETVARDAVFTEVIRIWRIIFDHDDQNVAIEKVCRSVTKSMNKGTTCSKKHLLVGAGGGGHSGGAYIPRTYKPGKDADLTKLAALETGGTPSYSAAQVADYFVLTPPAQPDLDKFNVIKFYTGTPELMNMMMLETGLSLYDNNGKVSFDADGGDGGEGLDNIDDDFEGQSMGGEGEGEGEGEGGEGAVFAASGRDVLPDVPFRATPQEYSIINRRVYSSVVLLGRAGTGKTTVCLYRMFRLYLTYWRGVKDGVPWHQSQTSRLLDFKRNQWALANAPLLAEEARAAAARETIAEEDEEDGTGSDDDGGAAVAVAVAAVAPLPPAAALSATPKVPNKVEHLHQLFLTRSKVLRAEVLRVFRGLQKGAGVTSIDASSKTAVYPFPTQGDALSSRPALPRDLRPEVAGAAPGVHLSDTGFPLFLTSREFLCLLDATLKGGSYFAGGKRWRSSGVGGMYVHRTTEGGANAEMSEVPKDFLSANEEDGDDDYDGEDDGEGEADRGTEADAFSKDGDTASLFGPDASVASGGSSLRSRRSVREKDKAELKAFGQFHGKEVTFEVFLETYWPTIKTAIRASGHLGAAAVSKFHASVVWQEIKSYIKSHPDALVSAAGALTLEQYLDLGRRITTMSADERTVVYEVCFRKYESMRKEKAAFDEMSWVHNLYTRMLRHGYNGVALHQVYIDEVQDFTLGELQLLILMCTDPNMLFFTGDTAQTIAKGVGFRFKDVTTLFSLLKREMEGASMASVAAAKKASSSLLPYQPPPVSAALIVVPKLEQLSHNYRTHSGILNMAFSVIAVLRRLFPYSIDVLEQERGLFQGMRPKLVLSTESTDLAALLAGSSSKSAKAIDFGAKQVILVRDADSKRALPEILKAGALVMTVPESKGLEMDDVLLYNFWRDSPAKEEWRVLVALMVKQTEDDAAGATTGQGKAEALEEVSENALNEGIMPVEEFLNVAGSGAAGGSTKWRSAKNHPFPTNLVVEGVHVPAAILKNLIQQISKGSFGALSRVMESELKYLYVALTRARVNLWIFDEGDSPPADSGGAPITKDLWARTAAFEFFQRQGVVDVLKTQTGDEDDASGATATGGFASSSSAEEWAEKGSSMIKQGLTLATPSLFKFASQCFAKAGALFTLEREKILSAGVGAGNLSTAATRELNHNQRRHERAVHNDDASMGMFHYLEAQRLQKSGSINEARSEAALSAKFFLNAGPRRADYSARALFRCDEPYKAGQLLEEYSRLRAVQAGDDGDPKNKVMLVAKKMAINAAEAYGKATEESRWVDIIRVLAAPYCENFKEIMRRLYKANENELCIHVLEYLYGVRSVLPGEGGTAGPTSSMKAGSARDIHVLAHVELNTLYPGGFNKDVTLLTNETMSLTFPINGPKDPQRRVTVAELLKRALTGGAASADAQTDRRRLILRLQPEEALSQARRKKDHLLESELLSEAGSMLEAATALLVARTDDAAAARAADILILKSLPRAQCTPVDTPLPPSLLGAAPLCAAAAGSTKGAATFLAALRARIAVGVLAAVGAPSWLLTPMGPPADKGVDAWNRGSLTAGENMCAAQERALRALGGVGIFLAGFGLPPPSGENPLSLSTSAVSVSTSPLPLATTFSPSMPSDSHSALVAAARDVHSQLRELIAGKTAADKAGLREALDAARAALIPGAAEPNATLTTLPARAARIARLAFTLLNDAAAALKRASMSPSEPRQGTALASALTFILSDSYGVAAAVALASEADRDQAAAATAAANAAAAAAAATATATATATGSKKKETATASSSETATTSSSAAAALNAANGRVTSAREALNTVAAMCDAHISAASASDFMKETAGLAGGNVLIHLGMAQALAARSAAASLRVAGSGDGDGPGLAALAEDAAKVVKKLLVAAAPFAAALSRSQIAVSYASGGGRGGGGQGVPPLCPSRRPRSP